MSEPTPRNVRNFWTSTQVDGRSSTLAGGPVDRLGGFSTTIYVRNEGCVELALTIDGYATTDGKLRLSVRDGDGLTLHESVTAR